LLNLINNIACNLLPQFCFFLLDKAYSFLQCSLYTVASTLVGFIKWVHSWWLLLTNLLLF